MSDDATGPKADPKREGTSVHLGPERIGYLDALAAHYGQPSRAAALITAWLEVTDGAIVRAKPRPPRAPLPVVLRAYRTDGTLQVCQLSGPAWAQHGAAVQAVAHAAGVPLSRVCREAIDAHAEAHAGRLAAR